MPIAAVPDYLGKDFKDASPGMRFSMFLCLWGVDVRNQRKLWTMHDIKYETRGNDSIEREVKSENKMPALRDATRLGAADQKTMRALLARQAKSFDSTANPVSTLCLDALATAPFTTGLGNEHPLENGFAFLNPYGLPYLPGSGVKGVLRQAARELASGEWSNEGGWSDAKVHTLKAGNHCIDLSTIDVLFGLQSADSDTQHVRGALTFWDVIPQIKGDSLAVDVMTPHQGHYYQQKNDPKSGSSTSPHESGQPIPIYFLTVPPGSHFVFHVQCDFAHLERCAPSLSVDGRWKVLMEAAFAHAFKWLGFGAKTAVGYGAMQSDGAAAARRIEAEQTRRRQEVAERQRQEELARMSPAEREIEVLLRSPRTDENKSDISVIRSALREKRWDGAIKIEIARILEQKMRQEKKWKEKSEKKNPDKDYDLKNTLEVLAWLEGK
jgi:CRISPR-associated protein Cmr6